MMIFIKSSTFQENPASKSRKISKKVNLNCNYHQKIKNYQLTYFYPNHLKS